MRGASPIVYPARIAYKRLKRVIGGEPETYPGNMEEYRLFLAVSLDDLFIPASSLVFLFEIILCV